MDDPSLLPFLNNNGNGHSYSIDIDDEIEHEEDELDDEDDDERENDDERDELQTYEQNQQFQEDETEEDEIEEDEIDDDENQDEHELVAPPPPPPIQEQQTIQSERGGRRKGVPRRLQLSPQVPKGSASQQRLLPLILPKSLSNVQHYEEPLLAYEQDDENESEDRLNNDEYYSNYNEKDMKSQQLNFLSKHFNDYDENNNHHYNEDENILEIVDDLLAELVERIVVNVKQERQENIKRQRNNNGPVNGFSNHKQQIKPIQKNEYKSTNGKHHHNNDPILANSIKSPKSQSSMKSSDPQSLFNELTKMMHLNSQQQLVKHKHSSSQSLSSSLFSSPPSAKRQKISDTSSSLSQATTPLSLQQQQQHQQLLLQMTQQLMMSAQSNGSDASSLLKQQLLGLTPPIPIPKRVGRPPKQQVQPQVMRSSTNMIPPTSHASPNGSSFERGNFAPRRRGRPPKYVTERGALPGLTPHDLDPTSYDQLFAAIENSATGNSSRTSPSAAFQSALASMLGQQTGLSIPPSLSNPSGARNGAPASMVKQSAGQTRHSLPASGITSKISGNGNGLDMSLLTAKKRGPGRPPKTQMLIDSHQLLQATKRINSSSSLSNNNNSYPPTMIPPSSPSSFNLNAAFVELLQQQQHPH